jgi:ComF family protein
MVNNCSFISQFRLRRYCALCGAITNNPYDLCSPCETDLPWIKAACTRCGIGLPFSSDTPLCGECLAKPPPFTRCIAPFRYEFPVVELINGFKFNGQLRYGRLLGTLLLQQLQAAYHSEPLPECIIPVPLHWRRLQKRGYNQSREIARQLASGLDLPCRPRVVKRRRYTTSQQSLNRKQRLKNLRHAFKVKPGLPYRRVAVVDDVFTTGVTLAEFSNALISAGIEEVHCWCLARTPLHR